MLLAKHVTGKPLSPAEHRQRRDAARARWAALAAAGTGAAIGAGLGVRQVYLGAPRAAVRALDQAYAEVDVGHARRQTQIAEAIAHRLRARRDVAGPPVVGNTVNREIYDFQIDQLERRIRAAPAAELPALRGRLTRLQTLRANAPAPIGRRATVRRPPSTGLGDAQAAFRLTDRQLQNAQGDYEREFRGAKRPERLNQLRTELHRLNDLRTTHATRVQQLQAAQVPVRAATEQRPKPAGETNPALERRIAEAKTHLRTRRAQLLRLLEARTAKVRTAAREQAIREAEVTLRLAARRAGGKGALIGAGLGLTAAGIGLLARHLAIHGLGKKNALQKFGSFHQELEKAQGDRTGADLAAVYRRWIDRLLGRTQTPMNLGDGVAEGVGPDIIQGFAEGARSPPIDREGSEPRSYIDVDFDQLNPSVRRHMAEYALDRIVAITDAQREAIREAIMNQSVLQGIGPYEVARTIKNSIGLTPYQMSVVASFEQQLRQLDPRVMERKLRDRRFDPSIKKAMDSGVPLTDQQINDMVDAYHRRFVALRARTIARTEGLRATSYGGVARAQQVLDENPDLDVIKRWLATEDERTRDTHRDLDGREVEGILTNFVTSKGNQIRWPLDDKAAAEEVINCFPAGVSIEGSVLGAVHTFYEGPLIQITLKSGTQLPVTPNHPIMTCEGMMKACLLSDRMYLVRYASHLERSTATRIVDHDQYSPVFIKQIFDAIRIRGGGHSRAELRIHDLHGDAQHGKRYIDVAWADRKLLNDFMTEKAEGDRDVVFVNAPVSQLNGASQRPGALDLLAVSHASPAFPGGANLANDMMGIELDGLPFQNLRVGLASQCDASLYQPSLNGSSAETNFIRQLIDRGASITADKIVDIQIRQFRGHLYDVQTVGGWSVANGILVSNCRCTLQYVFKPKRGQLMAVAA